MRPGCVQRPRAQRRLTTVPWACIALLLSGASGCAPSQPKGPLPGSPRADQSAEQRELAQLMRVARQAETRWRDAAKKRRRIRERLLVLRTANGDNLSLKELHHWAEKAGLKVSNSHGDKPTDGRFCQAQPGMIEAVGPLASVAAFFKRVRRARPRYRVVGLEIARWPGPENEVNLTARIDVITRKALPPPTPPPPPLIILPRSNSQAISLLRQHILQVGKLVQKGQWEGEQLAAAEAEIFAGHTPAASTLGPLRNGLGPVTLLMLNLRPGHFQLKGEAPTDEEIIQLVSVLDKHKRLRATTLSERTRERLPSGIWISRFTLDAELVAPASQAAQTAKGPKKP